MLTEQVVQLSQSKEMDLKTLLCTVQIPDCKGAICMSLRNIMARNDIGTDSVDAKAKEATYGQVFLGQTNVLMHSRSVAVLEHLNPNYQLVIASASQGG